MSDKHDLNDARQAYFSLGGVESDIGPRDGSSWYWRRAVELAVRRAELAEELCVALADRLALREVDDASVPVSTLPSDWKERVDRFRRRAWNPGEKKLMEPFSYRTSSTPVGYCCYACGTTGKLWRDTRAVATAVKLYCGACALKVERRVGPIDERGRVYDGYEWSEKIGNLLPAVPTEDGRTFWGYTSVPVSGAAWWRRLPICVWASSSECGGKP